MIINIPQKVHELLNILYSHGFEAYVVGGCVRDSLLSKTPNDWDITTNALPQEIMKIFSKFSLITTGLKHGTVGIIYEKEVFEVTTYRIDGKYTDNRHPESVKFTNNISDDLSRRDFTINAIAYSEKSGLVDPYGGKNDIENKIIKCVGNPYERFNEDSLRILRALRFSSGLGFNIEKSTANDAMECRVLLDNIARERIASELIKIITGSNCGYVLRKFRRIIAQVIPQLSTMFHFNQNTPYHNLSLWEHTVRAVESISPSPVLRTVMLFHDIGKPKAMTIDEKGISHYHGHAKYSAKTAEEILLNLRMPSKFTEDVTQLILYHDYFCIPEEKPVKKLLFKIGFEKAYQLAEIQRADASAKANYKSGEREQRIESFISILDKIKARDDCFTLKKLEVNGRDIMSLGINEGELVGRTLNKLLSLVINEEVNNDKTALLKAAKEYIKKQQ